MITNVQANDYYPSSLGGYLTTARTQLLSDLTSALGAANILKSSNNGTTLDVTFKFPNTQIFVRAVMSNTSWQVFLGSGVDASGNLLNPVESTFPFARGLSGGYGWNPVHATAISETGLLMSLRTPVGLDDNRYATKTFGVALLLDAQGAVIPDRCDVWHGWYGYLNQDAEQFQRGEWMVVRRWERTPLAFTKTTFTRMPFIGFAQFPQGVDTINSKLYGIKTYSPLAPYEESAMWRTFPGDAFTEGQTVTDSVGRKWYLADRASSFWTNLTSVFPHQINIYGTRTALAW